MDTDLLVRTVHKNKQTVTLLEGLDKSYNVKYILTALCTVLSCSGSILQDPEVGTTIELIGNHQEVAVHWLMKEGYLRQN
jgi:translation initiation factor 1 (eIF-1/SUI1)